MRGRPKTVRRARLPGLFPWDAVLEADHGGESMAKDWWRPVAGAAGEAGARDEQDRMIEDAAGFVQRMGMIAPAMLFGEALKPLSWIGSQGIHFLAPLAGTILGFERVDKYGYLLEDRGNVERFLDRLEELADEERGK